MKRMIRMGICHCGNQYGNKTTILVGMHYCQGFYSKGWARVQQKFYKKLGAQNKSINIG